MYTGEIGFVKKQLRLHREFSLLEEYCMQSKAGCYLLIIGVKRYGMNDDTNLIDISMLQQLQDQFCCADHLYLMCVDKNKGVVTKPFGTEEQVGFLRTQVDKHAYMELVDQMQHDRMETVVERETAQDS